MEIKQLPINKIVGNEGQIEGPPKNPRFIRDEKFLKLVQSLKESPEILEGRPLWVFPFNGVFVAIGGNMRHKAAKELKWKTINCCIIPEDTPVAKLREITIKDNLGYGENDMDALANEWDLEELKHWGQDLPVFEEIQDSEEYGDSFDLKSGDREPFQQMTFTFSDSQGVEIKNLIAEIKKTQEYKFMETDGNENSNGNALYLICKQWAEQKTSF